MALTKIGENEHKLDLVDRKFEKNLTRMMSVVGRKGPLSAIHIKEEMKKEDPKLEHNYTYELLRKLCPKDDTVPDKPLFSWDDLLTKPEKVKEKLKRKLVVDQTRTILQLEHNLNERSNKGPAQLQINKGNAWTRFEIKYETKTEKPIDNTDKKDAEKEKITYSFFNDTFKVIQCIEGKETIITKLFCQKRKGRKLYVYTTGYSYAYLNKTIDKSKIKEINLVIEPKVAKYIMENLQLITNDPRIRHLSKEQKRNKIIEKFGLKATPKIEAIVESFSQPEESESEVFDHIFHSIVRGRYDRELNNLDQGFWLFSLNIRGFMKYFIPIVSESKIEKVIEGICNDRQYQYAINKNHELTNINIRDLEFPFLLYYDELSKILPEKFAANKLKQIAKRLEGLIDEISLNELIFLVTYHYYNDFEYFMNSKPILHGLGSYIEGIKSKDINLYRMVMDYHTILLRYIETFQESDLRHTKHMRILFEAESRGTTVSCKLCGRRRIVQLQL